MSTIQDFDLESMEGLEPMFTNMSLDETWLGRGWGSHDFLVNISDNITPSVLCIRILTCCSCIKDGASDVQHHEDSETWVTNRRVP